MKLVVRGRVPGRSLARWAELRKPQHGAEGVSELLAEPDYEGHADVDLVGRAVGDVAGEHRAFFELDVCNNVGDLVSKRWMEGVTNHRVGEHRPAPGGPFPIEILGKAC